MGQVSKFLRTYEGGFTHWCPGCESLHMIAVSEPFPNEARWRFDGNVEKPTFNPSVLIRGKQQVVKDGVWTGEWVRDAQGNAVDACCHYFLHAGELKFCGDSTHQFAGKTVPLPELPPHLRDGAQQ